MGKVSGGAGRAVGRAAGGGTGAVALGRQPGDANAGDDQADRILAEVQRMGVRPAINPGVTVQRQGSPLRISAQPGAGMRWRQDSPIQVGDTVRITRMNDRLGKVTSYEVENMRTLMQAGSIRPGPTANVVEMRSAIRQWVNDAGLRLAVSSKL